MWHCFMLFVWLFVLIGFMHAHDNSLQSSFHSQQQQQQQQLNSLFVMIRACILVSKICFVMLIKQEWNDILTIPSDNGSNQSNPSQQQQ